MALNKPFTSFKFLLNFSDYEPIHNPIWNIFAVILINFSSDSRPRRSVVSVFGRTLNSIHFKLKGLVQRMSLLKINIFHVTSGCLQLWAQGMLHRLLLAHTKRINVNLDKRELILQEGVFLCLYVAYRVWLFGHTRNERIRNLHRHPKSSSPGAALIVLRWNAACQLKCLIHDVIPIEFVQNKPHWLIRYTKYLIPHLLWSALLPRLARTASLVLSSLPEYVLNYIHAFCFAFIHFIRMYNFRTRSDMNGH